MNFTILQFTIYNSLLLFPFIGIELGMCTAWGHFGEEFATCAALVQVIAIEEQIDSVLGNIGHFRAYGSSAACH